MTGTAKCPDCGSQLPVSALKCEKCQANLKITWETDITLLSNPLFLRQLLFVAVGAGLTMAVILVFVFAATGEYDAIPMMLLVSLFSVIGLGVFFILITFIVFGNRTRVRFTVDNRGAYWKTIDKRAKSLNRMTILAGILGHSPQAAGAGTLAASRENEFVGWSQIALIESNRRHLMINLRNSWRTVMMLICLPENFETVLEYAGSRVVKKPVTREKVSKPLGKGVVRTLLVILAAAPVFQLSSPYVLDLDIFLPLLMFVFALATVWLTPFLGWVVIGSAAVIFIQLIFVGYHDFYLLYNYEQVIYLLAFIGLFYLAWFSWRSIRGIILPPLLED